MKRLSLLTGLMVVCVAFSAFAMTEDFEDWPLENGWYVTNGSSQVVFPINHTPGGFKSVELTQGSASFTLSVEDAALTAGSVDYWFYGTSEPTYGGAYDVQELMLKDSSNTLVAQTWFRSYAIREYKAGGYTPTVPGSAGVIQVGQWNHVNAAWDCTAGTYTITVNDSFVWSTGFAGADVDIITFTHQNKNGASIYLDDVVVSDANAVPEPSILALGLLTLIRRKK